MSNNNVRAAKAMSDEIERLMAIENPTAEQTEAMEGLIAAAPAVARAAKIERLRNFAGQPGHVEVEAESAFNFNRGVEVTASEARQLVHRDDPASRRRLSDLARSAIDRWSSPAHHKESAEAKVTDCRTADARGVAEFVAATSSDTYAEAYAEYLRGGWSHVGSDRMGVVREAQRAAMVEGTTTAGGFLVPSHLDPSIILTNAGSANPYRRISRVETISTQTWNGVSSAGVTGEWLAEAAEATDASPTFDQPSCTPIRASAYVQASIELMQDSTIGSQIGALFSDAKDRLESTAFTTGNGTTQPLGILTELRANTASTMVNAQTNASFGSVDIYAVINDLDARWQDGASWVANRSVYNLARQFASGAGPSASFWVDFGGGTPATMVGYPTYQSSAMPAAPLSSATASSDDILILGDFSNYLIVDRVGMEVVFNPLVLGANRRPTGEVGWFAYWRVGSEVLTTEAFRFLRV